MFIDFRFGFHQVLIEPERILYIIIQKHVKSVLSNVINYVLPRCFLTPGINPLFAISRNVTRETPN
jgi:hypothetical protein